MRPPASGVLGSFLQVRLGLDSLVVTLLRGQQQLGQGLSLDHTEGKDGEHDRQQYGGYVKNTSQTLPAFPLRIIKNLFHSLLVVWYALYGSDAAWILMPS